PPPALYTLSLHDALPIWSASVAVWPSRSTTSAFTVSPHFSSGTPMTAHSATAGCWKRQSSTSIDDTFSPPEMMTSFLRSAITTRSEEHTSELQSRGHLVC